MNETNTDKTDETGARVFGTVLEDFTHSTARLEAAFATLGDKFEKINRELERKNEDLKKALIEKEEAQSYLRSILENLTTGVAVGDADENVTMMNGSAESLTGVSLEDARGKHIGLLFENCRLRDSNDRVDIGHLANNMGDRFKLGDVTLEIFGSTVNKKSREKIGIIVVIRDVTRLDTLEEMAKREEKLASMGEMAANIAHEIRNPLGSIELFASLLARDSADKKSRDRASLIIRSVKDMDIKISNLLLFTKRQRPVIKRINVHGVLQEILTFSKQIIDQEEIILVVDYDDADPVMEADAEMLKHLFLNLILNAMQAMPDGGELSIQTRIFAGDGMGTPAGSPHVEVTFGDTGVGIPHEYVRKIFDPFFTTKKRGSGLGLSIVHNIVDVHGGSIQVGENKKGGSLFTVMLPLAEGACRTVPSERGCGES
ncbi:MAG: ATP-binding protein [Syntrophales bacterium]|nr:ATP-binding protein [Syntrophales bacterium]